MSILQTIDLKKYYGTEPNITRALDGVNFSVEDGEFVAVVARRPYRHFADIWVLQYPYQQAESLERRFEYERFTGD